MEKKEIQKAELDLTAVTEQSQLKSIEKTYNLYSSLQLRLSADENNSGETSGYRNDSESVPVISSAEDLRQELKESLKKSSGAEKKVQVNKIIEEMETAQENFFTGERGILKNLKKSEASAAAKKLREMEVPREVTEVNVSAILTGLSNRKNKKRKR